LKALAGVEPRWTLTGGAALAGFHLGHRTTRDLDLFWHGHGALADLVASVTGTLSSAGFTVRGLRRTPTFAQLQVESVDGVVEVEGGAVGGSRIPTEAHSQLGQSTPRLLAQRDVATFGERNGHHLTPFLKTHFHLRTYRKY
jgi:hypothetical protein